MGRPLGRPRARAAARRPRRRLWLISPEGFRELRHSCLLSQRGAAAYLGVCVRTVRHWDSGRNRVPWSAVRLLRLLRAGDLGGLCDEWQGWTINRLGLHAPDGRTFRERDMRQLWLTVTQAALFREGSDRATLPGAAQPRERLEGASPFPRQMVGQGEGRTRETVQAVGRQARPFPAEPASGSAGLGESASRDGGGSLRASEASAEPAALGLVSYATKDRSERETAQRRGLAGVDVTSQRRQSDVTSPTGATDGTNPTYLAIAARSGRHGGGAGHASGADRERVHRSGGAQLGGVSGEAAGPIQPPCGRPCPEFEPGDCPFSNCPERAEGGGERAVPLRERPEVQALPRAALKCDTRPVSEADRAPRLLNATGAEAPRDDAMAVRKYREQQLRLLAMWREVLRMAVELGPLSESREDLDAFGEAKDYVIGQVERHEAWLESNGCRPGVQS